MFSIITGYKKLFLLCVRSEFTLSVTLSDWDVIKDDGDGVLADDLIDKILDDWRIDWDDKEEVIALVERMKNETDNVKVNTRLFMDGLLKSMLDDWYTINDEKDLITINTLLNRFLWKNINIPTAIWQMPIKKLSINSDMNWNIVLYNWNSQIWIFDKDWKYEEDSSFWRDESSDNNLVNDYYVDNVDASIVDNSKANSTNIRGNNKRKKAIVQEAAEKQRLADAAAEKQRLVDAAKLKKYDLSKVEAIMDESLVGDIHTVTATSLNVREGKNKKSSIINWTEITLTWNTKMSDWLKFVEIEWGGYVALKHTEQKVDAAEQQRLADEAAAEQQRLADEAAAEQQRLADEAAAEEKLNPTSLDTIRSNLDSMTLVESEGQYFFVGEWEASTALAAGNIESVKSILKSKEEESVLSIEEVLWQIKWLDWIQLAFNEKLSEKEKLAYVMQILWIENMDVRDLDKKDKTVTFEAKSQRIDIIDLPRADFKDWIYEKEGFEKRFIKEINKVIPENVVRTADKSIEDAIVIDVNKILNKYWIDSLNAQELSLTNLNEVADLIIGKNIFDNIKITATVTIENWIYNWIPQNIENDSMYKIVKGEEEVIMKGSVLSELLAKNDKKESKAMEDDRELSIDESDLALESLWLDQSTINKIKKAWYKLKEHNENEYIFSSKNVFSWKEVIYNSETQELKANWKVIKSVTTETIADIFLTLKVRLENVELQKDEAEAVEKLKTKEQKEKEKKIREALGDVRFTIEELFGKTESQLENSTDPFEIKAYTWLSKFSKSSRKDWIKFDDMQIDLENWTIKLEFDDKWIDARYNWVEISTAISFNEEWEFDIDLFKKQFLAQINNKYQEIFKKMDEEDGK